MRLTGRKLLTGVPEILTPAQFKTLLETAEEEVPELIPFLAMAGFAGVRRSELVREYTEDQVLKWEDVTSWRRQLGAAAVETFSTWLTRLC